jgi:hypothetical protein
VPVMLTPPVPAPPDPVRRAEPPPVPRQRDHSAPRRLRPVRFLIILGFVILLAAVLASAG